MGQIISKEKKQKREGLMAQMKDKTEVRFDLRIKSICRFYLRMNCNVKKLSIFFNFRVPPPPPRPPLAAPLHPHPEDWAQPWPTPASPRSSSSSSSSWTRTVAPVTTGRTASTLSSRSATSTLRRMTRKRRSYWNRLGKSFSILNLVWFLITLNCGRGVHHLVPQTRVRHVYKLRKICCWPMTVFCQNLMNCIYSFSIRGENKHVWKRFFAFCKNCDQKDQNNNRCENEEYSNYKTIRLEMLKWFIKVKVQNSNGHKNLKHYFSFNYQVPI